jgi:hypothetical protein
MVVGQDSNLQPPASEASELTATPPRHVPCPLTGFARGQRPVFQPGSESRDALPSPGTFLGFFRSPATHRTGSMLRQTERNLLVDLLSGLPPDRGQFQPLPTSYPRYSLRDCSRDGWLHKMTGLASPATYLSGLIAFLPLLQRPRLDGTAALVVLQAQNLGLAFATADPA